MVCDVRGRIKAGAAEAVGSGRLLDADSAEKVRRLPGRKYLLTRPGDPAWVTCTPT